jgi:hypothetical protein
METHHHIVREAIVTYADGEIGVVRACCICPYTQLRPVTPADQQLPIIAANQDELPVLAAA